MTNIEAKEKAVEIIIGYNLYVRFKYQAIQCAILQVKSTIELLKEIRYRSKLQDYELILNELEKM